VKTIMGSFKEYPDLDGLALAGLVREKLVSSRELVDEAIERIDALNPKLNAIVARLDESAHRETALPLRGPFAGVPFLLKDLLSPLASVPFTSGSRYYRDHVPAYDSELVRRYKSGGLIIVAKTNTPEFGIMPVTESALFGPCRNPWDLSRTSGGSSGGSAAAVAAGIVPMAHGGDGGGSLRIPASCCGLFGLKPTRGRNPTGPDASEHWLGFAAEHVVTRSVRDSAAMLDLSSGPEPTSPYWAPPKERPFIQEVGAKPGKLRIAFTAKPHLPGTVHPECYTALLDAARLCENLGHTVEEATPEINAEDFALCFFTLTCASIAAGIDSGKNLVGRSPHLDEIETATRLAGLLGKQFSASDAVQAIFTLQGYARTVLRFFERYDLLLTPTLGSPPLKIGALEPRGAEAIAHRTIARLKLGPALKFRRIVEATVSRVFDFVPFTPVANVTGQPSMSVPLHFSSANLPVGTMFTARLGDEATLFRLAAQLEEARPWAKRRPPVR
jgi:amidase